MDTSQSDCGEQTKEIMFRLEQSRALFMLSLSCMPILIEMHGDMRTILDWKIVIPLFMYTLFAFKATSEYRKKPEIFQMYKQSCKASLCCVVVYAWLCLFFSIESTLAKCLVIQAQGHMKDRLYDCKRHGMQSKCVDAIQFVNRMYVATNQCPTSVLGWTLGTVYTLSVVCFRFIPTALYGLWNLYTWSDDRFMTPGIAVKASERETGPHVLPNNKTLTVCTIVLMMCVLVEAGIPQILPLCNFTTILHFVAILALQNSLNKHRMRDSSRHAMTEMQRMLCYAGIFHVIIDFVMNLMTILNNCVHPTVEEKLTSNQCSNPHGALSVEECYAAMTESSETFSPRSGMCPKDMSPPVTLLYGANIIQVITLTLGVLLSFWKR